jgi:hypothetical protein
MQARFALTLAVLGAAANIAWAANTTSVPAPPANPPLQCACVAGGPVA